MERSLFADARGTLRLCELQLQRYLDGVGGGGGWGVGAGGRSSVSLAVRPPTKTSPGGESRRCYFCLGMCLSADIETSFCSNLEDDAGPSRKVIETYEGSFLFCFFLS